MREWFSAQHRVAADLPPLYYGERVNVTVGRLVAIAAGLLVRGHTTTDERSKP